MPTKIVKLNTRQMDTTYIRGKDWMTNKVVNRMEYMTTIGFSSVTTPQSYIFRGNSIYDPDQTGTGSQPNGYTLMSSMFSNYECPSCYIRAEFINLTNIPIWITVAVNQNSSDAITYLDAQAKPGSKQAYVNGNASTAHGVCTNYNKTFDVIGYANGDDQVKGLVTGNPSKQWYWYVIVTSCDGASALTGTLNVKLIYNTIWTNRKVI